MVWLCCQVTSSMMKHPYLSPGSKSRTKPPETYPVSRNASWASLSHSGAVTCKHCWKCVASFSRESCPNQSEQHFHEWDDILWCHNFSQHVHDWGQYRLLIVTHILSLIPQQFTDPAFLFLPSPFKGSQPHPSPFVTSSAYALSNSYLYPSFWFFVWLLDLYSWFTGQKKSLLEQYKINRQLLNRLITPPVVSVSERHPGGSLFDASSHCRFTNDVLNSWN